MQDHRRSPQRDRRAGRQPAQRSRSAVRSTTSATPTTSTAAKQRPRSIHRDGVHAILGGSDAETSLASWRSSQEQQQVPVHLARVVGDSRSPSCAEPHLHLQARRRTPSTSPQLMAPAIARIDREPHRRHRRRPERTARRALDAMQAAPRPAASTVTSSTARPPAEPASQRRPRARRDGRSRPTPTRSSSGRPRRPPASSPARARREPTADYKSEDLLRRRRRRRGDHGHRREPAGRRRARWRRPPGLARRGSSLTGPRPAAAGAGATSSTATLQLRAVRRLRPVRLGRACTLIVNAARLAPRASTGRPPARIPGATRSTEGHRRLLLVRARSATVAWSARRRLRRLHGHPKPVL